MKRKNRTPSPAKFFLILFLFLFSSFVFFCWRLCTPPRFTQQAIEEAPHTSIELILEDPNLFVGELVNAEATLQDQLDFYLFGIYMLGISTKRGRFEILVFTATIPTEPIGTRISRPFVVEVLGGKPVLREAKPL